MKRYAIWLWCGCDQLRGAEKETCCCRILPVGEMRRDRSEGQPGPDPPLAKLGIERGTIDH